MKIHYFGWSGVAIQHGDTLVGVDLFGEAVTWDKVSQSPAIILCLTHGHPEHCGSLRRFLLAPQARPYLSRTHLVSSPPVVAHIQRGGVLPPQQVHSVGEGDRVIIGGVHITAFSWRHLPLLPSGLRPSLEYLAHLASRPLDLVRIGLAGLQLPMNAPMLGFHIRFADGQTVLNYAEGLHRLTDPLEVQNVARALPAEALLFAVEPEDVDALPHWVEVLRPQRVYLYEAHRPWRELFRLPYVDLNDYACQLSGRFPTIHFQALPHPGVWDG